MEHKDELTKQEKKITPEIIDIITDKVGHSEWDLESDFYNDICIDSLERIEIIHEIETKYSIKINDFHREDIDNPISLIKYVVCNGN